MTSPLDIVVRAGGGAHDYSVLIEPGLRRTVAAEIRRRVPEVRSWALVTDEHVGPLYAAEVEAGLRASGVQGPRITLPAGEGEKSRSRWGWVTDRMLEAGIGRDGGVIALGGGVIGDLAGFVAATFMRGIPVVQLPTSLLAMVDASVGGKTGVDTPQGKNLVGAFHPPRVVMVDPEVVATLPEVQRRHGLAEALKHAAIVDAGYGEWITASAGSLLAGRPEAVLHLVRRSVEIKAGVVSRDEREGGLREILNFGHTVAHALEHVTDYRLPHGSAVALGMVAEASIGEAEGTTEPGSTGRIVGWLRSVGLTTHLENGPEGWSEADPGDLGPELAEGLLRDKKVRDGSPRVVLLACVGEVARTSEGAWARPVPVKTILAHLPWSAR